MKEWNDDELMSDGEEQKEKERYLQSEFEKRCPQELN